MNKVIIWSLVVSLVISIVAPYGATFAMDAEIGPVEMEASEMSEVLEVSADEAGQVVEEAAEVVEAPLSVGEVEPAEIIVEEVADVAVDEPSVIPIRISDKRLVISYAQTSSIYGKYVKVTNISDTDYYTRGLTLQYIRASDRAGSNPDLLAHFYGTIGAGASVVVGNTTVEEDLGQSADVYFSQTANTVMSPSGGWLLLTEGVHELDSFCWAGSSGGLCGDDYYEGIPFVQGEAYARCLSGGVAVECQPYVWFERVPMRAATAGGGFTPFYNVCSGVSVSEVAPRLLDQFIELYNETDQTVSLEMCILQINTRVYQFDMSQSIEPGGYMLVSPEAIGVPLARTTAGEVRLLSSAGEQVDSLKYDTPKEDRSVIMAESGQVLWTLRPTPAQANEYVQYPACEAGYWRNEETGRCNKDVEPAAALDCGEGRERNPDTGRCRNVPTIRELAPCRGDQYRSEETNRCRSIASTAASVLKPCADDQFRNPLTNRCNKIASAEEVALADCGEGRERNPATNRCRNVLSATMPAAPFAPDEVVHAAQGTLGWWAFGGVSLLAVGYAGWQWRFEIGRLAGRIGRVFASTPKQ